MTKIFVRARSGAITLTGSVPDSTQIGKAEEVTRGVAGVTSVTSKLSLQAQNYQAALQPGNHSWDRALAGELLSFRCALLFFRTAVTATHFNVVMATEGLAHLLVPPA